MTSRTPRSRPAGSSPRSRGPRRKRRQRREHRRFIPAFAGTTHRRSRCCRSRSVHPRVRGDHTRGITFVTFTPGSSPRSRGPPGHSAGASVAARFIPAFAGTTSIPRTPPGEDTVHPRVRGDHGIAQQLDLQRLGSSPRSRGPLQAQRLDLIFARFIPAFAGTTSKSIRCSTAPTVHPRVRGDHREVDLLARSRLGSSPRSRGPQLGARWGSTAGRFIPAFAGTTGRREISVAHRTVHPRVRGDHVSARRNVDADAGSSPRSRGPRIGSWKSRPTAGSSPRSRGPRNEWDVRREAERFIPAFAGTTDLFPDGRGRGAVHPRVRGDHAGTKLVTFSTIGSSPRSRGPHRRSP